MTPRTGLACAGLAVAVGLGGCFDEPPVPAPGVPVFGDAFTPGLTPNAFEGSLLTSLSVDDTRAYEGAASIRLEVPAVPAYSGGAVLAAQPQDLTEVNALVFWASASTETTFNELGFGLNFNPHPSTFQVTAKDLPLTTEWTRHLLPIPDPSRLTAERGMFWFADANPTAYRAWFDDVRFDRLDPESIALQPEGSTTPRTLAVGGTAQVGGLRLAYTDFDGTRRSVAAPGYFTFASSDTAVATVDATGKITGVGVGEARVTARVGNAETAGVPVTVVQTLPTEPTAAPPRPTHPPDSVISLLSAAYTPRPVDTWRTPWSMATLTERTVGGEPLKRYTSLDFVGVEFAGANTVDATGMTHLHLDVWTPNATALRVKLVDYGPGGTGGGGDDVEHELVIDASSSPDLANAAWLGLDLPLERFAGLTRRSKLGLLVLSTSPAGAGTLFVGNVYFHK